MAFRIETRAEMLAAFFFYANDEEQAAAKIQEIMGRQRTQQLSYAIQRALETGMTGLANAEPTSWKLFDWFTRNMSALLNAFEQQMMNPDPEAQQFNEYMRGFGPIDMENPPEIDMTMVPRSLNEVNGRAEDLISLTENLAIILRNMPPNFARPNIDGMSIEQAEAWAQENSRYIDSARWVEFNPVYTYQNGWKMIHLTNDDDYRRAGKELGNCVRHAPSQDAIGFLGHPGVFVLVDENEHPRVALRMGNWGNEQMYLCYDAKAFDRRQRIQIEAVDYKNYIDEFFANTTPSEVYQEQEFEVNPGARWQPTQGWLSRAAQRIACLYSTSSV